MSSAVTRHSSGPRILVVRLGAMGDVIHTLPAAASLKHSFANSHLTWVIEPQWAPLLERNPYIDAVAIFERGNPGVWMGTWRRMRGGRFDFAVDFQGLVKSALAASMARPDCIFGLHQSQVREWPAALFYSNRILTHATHIVDRHLELAAAAGAANTLRTFPLPEGKPEADLPHSSFVLACPLAGWRSKQWPLMFYSRLAVRLERELGLPLVLNGPPGAQFGSGIDAVVHHSSLAGLIYATRRAAAVVGIDSGPLHLAAALGKPGVAIFGPTDPARNGPYGETICVLRSPSAVTTYKRMSTIDVSMRDIDPDHVFEALKAQLARCSTQCAAP
jgi:heptosyltransferase-1